MDNVNMKDYRFISLGGGREVGGSCYAIKIGRNFLMLDAGIRNTSFNRVPDITPLYSLWGLDGLWELDAVIISHSHIDHTGALPIFMRDINNVRIYSSQATPDMLSAQNKYDSSYNKARDVASISDMLIPVEFYKEFRVKDLALKFFPAGHITGAAMTLIQHEDRKILYTGDFCDFNQYSVKGADVPDMKIDTLICESTYGYSKSIGAADLVELAQRINMFMNHSYLITCPVRNSGKAPEITLAVLECMHRKLIPEFDIWLDDSSEAFCRVCEKWNGINILGEQHIKPINDYVQGSMGLIISGENFSRLPSLAFNMSNHADCDGILDLIFKTKPDKIIFVHGVPLIKSPRNIVNEVRERFGDSIEVIHGINGQEIPLLNQ